LALDFKGALVTVEAVFYTQIGSILAFVVSLFILYRLLVSSKDATIEILKQQVGFLEAKIKALAEQGPDVLLQRVEKRASLLEKELEAAEKEKEPLTAEIEELKKKIAAPESQAQLQALVNQLVAVSQHVALLNAERQQLVQHLRELEVPYQQFLHYANAELSPGRRQIVGEIVSYIGIDRVIAFKPEEIMRAFAQLAAETRVTGMHPNIPINGGALTGLRSVGLINDRDELTLVGVSMFKSIAKELKSNNPVEQTAHSVGSGY
jgi:chaperonin cofactor prefoldin